MYFQGIFSKQDLLTVWTWTREAELVKDNSKCLRLSNRAHGRRCLFQDGRLWEEQVEGIMSSVPDMQRLRCPLTIQMEAFTRLGLSYLAFKTRALNEIRVGGRS